MTASTFDALAATRDLEAAGIERRQAEAIAEGMRQAASADRGDFATKADLAHFATKSDLADLENRLRAELASKSDLETLRSELRWMLGFLAALILAMAAKLFGVV